MAQPTVVIEIDQQAEAAYIRLSSEPVVTTCEATKEVQVDLDHLGVVVGVEILRLGTDVPWTDLARQFHIRSDVAVLLDSIRSTYSQVLQLSHGAEGVSAVDDELQRA